MDKWSENCLATDPVGYHAPACHLLYRQWVVLSPDALLAEIAELEAAHVDVRERLQISAACPLILPYHVALDQAREAKMAAAKIGTTGRGIGPAYEDKVARRALRVQDLFDLQSFENKLEQVLDYHNFVLTRYLDAPAVTADSILDKAGYYAEQLEPMVADVSHNLFTAGCNGDKLLFEGAQGALLDIDHGTYPYVTSSNCLSSAASAGCGVGPDQLNYVLGIAKCYVTRVGSGPFPTELDNDIGLRLAEVGKEFGSVTGRPRRCGWFDAAAMKRSVMLNGISGLCMTKLDVVDGLHALRIGAGYRYKGKFLDVLPCGAQAVAEAEPVLEEMPGWLEPTVGVTEYDKLPVNARRYLERIAELCDVPIDMVSTGPDRNETIVLRDPFGS